MGILTDEQLWGHIRGLQGQVVPTIDRGRPNPIRAVTEKLVEIEGRSSYPSRDYLVRCYHLVIKHRVLTERNLPHEFFDHRIARICMAILAKAVPQQIRAFPRGAGPVQAFGLSGIEVYNTDC